MARNYSVGFQLRTDTGKWRKDLARAKRDWSSTVGTMTRHGRRLALATAAVAAGFVAMARQGIKAADANAKAARNAGLSARAYQELAHVFERAGSSGIVLSKATQTLQRRILDGERGLKEVLDSFRDIGVSWETLSELSPEQAFLRTLEALRGVSDEGRRLALAQKLLGRAGRELGNVLAQTSEEIEEQRRRLRDLGGVLSGPLAKRAEDFEDAITDASKVVRTQFTAAILDALGPARDWDGVIRAAGAGVRTTTRFVIGIATAVWDWRRAVAAVLALWVTAKTVIFAASVLTAVLKLTSAIKGLAIASLGLSAATKGGFLGLASLAAIAAAGGILAVAPSEAAAAKRDIARLQKLFDARKAVLARLRSQGAAQRAAAVQTGQTRILEEMKRLEKVAAGSTNANRLQDVLDVFHAAFANSLAEFEKKFKEAADTGADTEPLRLTITKAFERAAERLNVVQRFPEGSPRGEELRLEAEADRRRRRADARLLNIPSRFPEGSPRGSDLGQAQGGRRLNFREIGAEFRGSLQASLSDALATGQWDDVGDALLDALSRSFADRVSQGFVDFLDPLMEGIFGSLEDAMSGAATKSTGSIFSKLGSVFSGLFKGFGSLLSGIFSGVGSFLGLSLHEGGRVPGRPGQEVPAVLEAGELVIPADEAGLAGGVAIYLQVTGDVTEATRKVLREDMPEIAAGVFSQFREAGVTAG